MDHQYNKLCYLSHASSSSFVCFCSLFRATSLAVSGLCCKKTPSHTESDANLADSVCMDCTLGNQEEASGTDGAFLTVRTTTAEVTVLLRSAGPTGQQGPPHLMASKISVPC